jgi:hypothetical protein
MWKSLLLMYMIILELNLYIHIHIHELNLCMHILELNSTTVQNTKIAITAPKMSNALRMLRSSLSTSTRLLTLCACSDPDCQLLRAF